MVYHSLFFICCIRSSIPILSNHTITWIIRLYMCFQGIFPKTKEWESQWCIFSWLCLSPPGKTLWPVTKPTECMWPPKVPEFPVYSSVWETSSWFAFSRHASNSSRAPLLYTCTLVRANLSVTTSSSPKCAGCFYRKCAGRMKPLNSALV